MTRVKSRFSNAKKFLRIYHENSFQVRSITQVLRRERRGGKRIGGEREKEREEKGKRKGGEGGKEWEAKGKKNGRRKGKRMGGEREKEWEDGKKSEK